MDKFDKIYVAGHNGLLGSAIVRLLNEKGYNNIITKSSRELDLRNQHDVESFFLKSIVLMLLFWQLQKLEVLKKISSFPLNF